MAEQVNVVRDTSVLHGQARLTGPLGLRQGTFLKSRDKDHSLKKIFSVVASKENTYWENQGYVLKVSGMGTFAQWGDHSE